MDNRDYDFSQIANLYKPKKLQMEFAFLPNNPPGWQCKVEGNPITGQGSTIQQALDSWVEGQIRAIAQ